MSDTHSNDFLRQGVAAAKAGDRAAARQFLEEALRLEPKSELAWFWYAGVLDDPQETLEALGYVLEINPQNEKALHALQQARLQLGISAVRSGDRERGRKILQECCRENPGSELSWLWLSGVTEDPEEAIGYLQKSLEINPNNDRAKAGLEYYKNRLEPARPPWHCPICQHTAMNKQHTCPGCGAILTLVEVDTILANGGADEELIRGGISRLLGRARVKPDFTIHCYIGLAYLNLNQLAEAINQFKVALRLQDHEPLRHQLDVLEKRQAERERESQRKATKNPKSDKRVLIVDDSATLRKLISIIAEKNGVQFSEAIDSVEAMEKIQQEAAPDLVLVEGEAAEAGGYQLCKALRADPKTKQVPIVILSQPQNWWTRLVQRYRGVTARVNKPFHPDEILSLLKQYQLVIPESVA
jgi:twitching motility two-component system response regulator PilH